VTTPVQADLLSDTLTRPTAGMREAMAHAEVDRLVQSVAVDQLVRHRRPAPANAFVRFLQSDDVGVDFVEHVEHAMRIAPPIDADGLAHIIGCDCDLGPGAH